MKMAACRTAGKKLRPHAKAHKCVEVAKRQIAAGAIGVCAATVPEAELMVRAGIPGVLLTSPLADPRKMARIARACSRHRRRHRSSRADALVFEKRPLQQTSR